MFHLRLKVSLEIESFKRVTQQSPSLLEIIKVGIDIFIRDRTFDPGLKFSTVWIEHFT